MHQSPGSLPLNDDIDYGLCFVCGPRHPSGLRLRFERDGDTVRTTFRVTDVYQGFPGYLHGAIIGAILDEVMSRVSVLEDRWSMTARMDVRYRRPVEIGQTVTAVAEKTGARRGFFDTRGRLELSDGTVAADAVAYLRTARRRGPLPHQQGISRARPRLDEIAPAGGCPDQGPASAMTTDRLPVLPEVLEPWSQSR